MACVSITSAPTTLSQTRNRQKQRYTLWDTHPYTFIHTDTHLHIYMCTPAHIHRKRQKYPLGNGRQSKIWTMCTQKKHMHKETDLKGKNKRRLSIFQGITETWKLPCAFAAISLWVESHFYLKLDANEARCCEFQCHRGCIIETRVNYNSEKLKYTEHNSHGIQGHSDVPPTAHKLTLL